LVSEYKIIVRFAYQNLHILQHTDLGLFAARRDSRERLVFAQYAYLNF